MRIEKEKNRSMLYYEICLLRLLSQMGYLDEKALNGIVRIAKEDYKEEIVLDRTFLCLN